MEDIQSSRKIVSMLRCGHNMHRMCLDAYCKANNMACPTCKKSLYDTKHNELIFQNYDL